MKLFKNLLLLLISLNSFLLGQLIEIKENNMLTEAKMFIDSKGINYSSLVKFGFNEIMVDMEKGEKIVRVSSYGAKLLYNKWL